MQSLITKVHTYSLLSPLPHRHQERIMILRNMKIQEMRRGEILATL
jgi:hypothetical protein